MDLCCNYLKYRKKYIKYKNTINTKIKNYSIYLCFLTCSLKSLAKPLKSAAKRLKFPDRCLTSEPKVANIKPVVNTAPILKITRERIISSTDQEPPRITLIIWYATKSPKITKRMVAIFPTFSSTLVSILTANLPLNQPNNKKDNYQNNSSHHPVKSCLLFHKLDKVLGI